MKPPCGFGPSLGGAISSHPVHGTVRSWDDESGWGVLTSPEVPGEVWAHFSAVSTPEPGAFASLEPGESVLFTWEQADQDDYAYRATKVRRPADAAADWDGENDDDDDEEDEEEDDVFALTDVHIEFDDE
ncbi:cold shock domain-containing protein [Streptomyces sp. DSM 3412]|uniref:Cold shock domain-containing protein n=1 Tax=Streptomyces gottesmaniae TaxID=3075518 RepID=A0ABU2ZB80_9ACTN|nr:cold shock domain-containing protein [Streptomyces sp. DSM 3412]MDT0573559.1 cold shock domain-containing protein [Streptomyces sp. DSM 3412]